MWYILLEWILCEIIIDRARYEQYIITKQSVNLIIRISGKPVGFVLRTHVVEGSTNE
jgi:hypothetical protein